MGMKINPAMKERTNPTAVLTNASINDSFLVCPVFCDIEINSFLLFLSLTSVEGRGRS